MATPTFIAPPPPGQELPEAEKSAARRRWEDLPEGWGVELIHGEIVMSPAPLLPHQRLFFEITFALGQYRIERDADFDILPAPTDVELGPDLILQPDICVVLEDRAERASLKRIYGAPNLVVEIQSPGTAKRDLGVKKEAYLLHGVQEYWLLDPMARTITVLWNEGNTWAEHASADKTGTASSRLLEGFSLDAAPLFKRAHREP